MKEAQLGLAAVTSRREAISAGLAIVSASTLGLAATSSSSSSSSNKIVFGSDRSGYAGLHDAAPLAVGLRWYFNDETCSRRPGRNLFPART
jgi:hypothetical protein